MPSANNGVKLELFIFDNFPKAQRMQVLQVARGDEFAPIKNAPGAPAWNRCDRCDRCIPGTVMTAVTPPHQICPGGALPVQTGASSHHRAFAAVTLESLTRLLGRRTLRTA